jgi:hypothetical protein
MDTNEWGVPNKNKTKIYNKLTTLTLLIFACAHFLPLFTIRTWGNTQSMYFSDIISFSTIMLIVIVSFASAFLYASGKRVSMARGAALLLVAWVSLNVLTLFYDDKQGLTQINESLEFIGIDISKKQGMKALIESLDIGIKLYVLSFILLCIGVMRKPKLASNISLETPPLRSQPVEVINNELTDNELADQILDQVLLGKTETNSIKHSGIVNDDKPDIKAEALRIKRGFNWNIRLRQLINSCLPEYRNRQIKVYSGYIAGIFQALYSFAKVVLSSLEVILISSGRLTGVVVISLLLACIFFWLN